MQKCAIITYSVLILFNVIAVEEKLAMIRTANF